MFCYHKLLPFYWKPCGGWLNSYQNQQVPLYPTTVLNTKLVNSYSILLHALIDYIKPPSPWFLYWLNIIKQYLCFDQNNVSYCIFASTLDMFQVTLKEGKMS